MKLELIPPIDFFQRLSVSPGDVLESAILLDILRGAPPSHHDQDMFRIKGWRTEIMLSEDSKRPDIDFFPLFYDLRRSIHPSLPYNEQTAFYVRRRFQQFRDRLIRHPPTFFARATHKNMSRSTRRHYEETFGGNLCVLDRGIFGQDDWQRIYHETGVQLEGEVEMRQKWYPSGAKPRTYFAMGGTCYRDSRFLQGFFTDLVNIFPSTNHITRLMPQLLRTTGDDDAFFIYDLSSFTSNMRQQKSFCTALAEFFRGVVVIVVDEFSGPRETDLGLLLDQYNETCVYGPQLSYERSPVSMGWSSVTSHKHGVASLLGIFGNLMTCTLGHFLILTPALDDPQLEDETAGDDGLVRTNPTVHPLVLSCIGFVGEFAEDKCYMSTERGSVCLKRPIWQEGQSLVHGKNVIPPTLMTAITYLSGENCDSRFEVYGLDDLTLRERVSIVGVDLLRFLRSAYNTCSREYQGRLSEVVRGFTRLREKICNPTQNRQVATEIAKSVWPIDPGEYDFFGGEEPFLVYAKTHITSFEMPETDVRPIVPSELRFCGDECIGNLDQRLVLLERLGYLVKEERRCLLVGDRAVWAWYVWFNERSRLPSAVYTLRCIKDIPECFVF